MAVSYQYQPDLTSTQYPQASALSLQYQLVQEVVVKILTKNES